MVNSGSRKFSLAVKIAVLFTFCVIMLGAYTRLSDAGLGCPDWPGCYGKMVLPNSGLALTKAQQAFPNIPIHQAKAWTEMAHRYCAGILGLFILALAIVATVRRRKDKSQPIILPWFIVAFVCLQAAFGMWTVTWKLLPVIVTAHLLGGMTLAALLTWLACSSRKREKHFDKRPNGLVLFAFIGLVIVVCQIFLGAWTSTNYAALACVHFPYCQGTLFPHMEWKHAFDMLHPIGPNYEGGRLDMAARVTIQMTHRYGAFITAIYALILSLCLILRENLKPLRVIGWMLLIALAAQVTLGILNIELLLPMWTAVSHNGMAAVLLITIVCLFYRSTHKSRA